MFVERVIAELQYLLAIDLVLMIFARWQKCATYYQVRELYLVRYDEVLIKTSSLPPYFLHITENAKINSTASFPVHCLTFSAYLYTKSTCFNVYFNNFSC